MNLKLLIISAPFESARRASAINYAESTGLPYEVLDGIDGDKLDVQCVPVAGNAYSFGPRILACYMSHIRALEIAASTSERCIIVEDDWKPTGHLGAAIGRVPNHVDYTVLHDLNYEGAPGVVVRVGDGWELMNPPPIVALAYVPSSHFIRFALREAFPITDHVDHFYRNVCMKYQLCCARTNPGVVTGAGFTSTLGHDNQPS